MSNKRIADWLFFDVFLPYNFLFCNKNNLKAINSSQFITFLFVLIAIRWSNSDFSCIIFSSTSRFMKHKSVNYPTATVGIKTKILLETGHIMEMGVQAESWGNWRKCALSEKRSCYLVQPGVPIFLFAIWYQKCMFFCQMSQLAPFLKYSDQLTPHNRGGVWRGG